MAVTPRTVRRKPMAKKSQPTLSASEALKAAEAALGSAPKTAPVKKTVSKPGRPKTAPALKADPVEIIAATTAVDAAPEPQAVPEPAVVPEPVAKTSPSETQPVKSLSPKAETVEPKLLATEGTKMMNEVIENGKKFAEEAKAKLETAYAGFNEKAKANVEKSAKAVEELSDLAKGNVEALVESGKIAAKGFETLGQEAADYGRKSIEKATASFKTFSSVKTPTEFFQLQSQFLSSSFDEFAKEVAKGGEALIKLSSDVAQPLTARVSVVTDKVKSLAA